MFLISISSVSEVNMDFTTDFYFRQGWKDPRLAFKPIPGIENLYVGAEVADKIWVPDTFFANEKSAYFHQATTFNTFLRLGHLGDVFRSIRLTVTASCPMNLQYFPMDSQLCSIEIESCEYCTILSLSSHFLTTIYPFVLFSPLFSIPLDSLHSVFSTLDLVKWKRLQLFSLCYSILYVSRMFERCQKKFSIELYKTSIRFQ